MHTALRLALLVFVLLAAASHAEPAPEFTLASNQGEELSLDDQRGKVVMINFWASWCAPCRDEMPLLESLYTEHKDEGFTLFGINIERNEEAVAEFLEEVDVSFPILYDPANKVSQRYQVSAMPTTVIVDQQGQVRHVNRGFRPGDGKKYRQQLEALLDE